MHEWSENGWVSAKAIFQKIITAVTKNLIMWLWHLSSIILVMFSSRIFLASRALAFDDNCPFVSSTASSRRPEVEIRNFVLAISRVSCKYFANFQSRKQLDFTDSSCHSYRCLRRSFMGTVNVFAEALSLPPKKCLNEKGVAWWMPQDEDWVAQFSFFPQTSPGWCTCLSRRLKLDLDRNVEPIGMRDESNIRAQRGL